MPVITAEVVELSRLQAMATAATQRVHDKADPGPVKDELASALIDQHQAAVDLAQALKNHVQ